MFLNSEGGGAKNIPPVSCVIEIPVRRGLRNNQVFGTFWPKSARSDVINIDIIPKFSSGRLLPHVRRTCQHHVSKGMQETAACGYICFFELLKVLSRGRIIFVPSINVRLKGQVKNVGLVEVHVRWRGDAKRSCCISADAFRRGTQRAAIRTAPALFCQKLETEN